jgi:N-acetylmuramic acid 6-phosphate etherase
MPNLGSLITEARNPLSEHIDELSTLEMLTVINREDATVATAVAATLPEIARAVDAIAERFALGGRLFYIGAGTSGRLGALDASECPPTFSVPPALVQGLIAGGDMALRKASEGAEDLAEEGERDLKAAGFGIANAADASAATPDTLVGISASGQTPYVLGALLYARSLRAFTVGVACVEGSPVSKVVDLIIAPATGPEVIAEHAFDRGDDPDGRGVQQPDGERNPFERQADRPGAAHHYDHRGVRPDDRGAAAD